MQINTDCQSRAALLCDFGSQLFATLGVASMTLTQFAMIIKGPGYDPVTSRATINSPFFSTTVVCVSSFEEAIFVANGLIKEGVQLIELCGGFTPDQADSLQASLGKHVPVGVVRYSSKEQQHLASLFGAPCA